MSRPVTGLSAAQEERLVDIAGCSVRLRGTLATHRALEKRGLVISTPQRSYQLTAAGLAIAMAIINYRRDTRGYA